MNHQRIVTFVDGLNLYHAIDRLRRNDLKWIDLRALSNVFINSNFEKLIDVFYFSAFADHIEKSAQRCQKNYINALKVTGVKPILGHFKKKDRKCPTCHNKWTGFEDA